MSSDLCFIDTHTHLATAAFDEDRDDAINRAQAAGVTTFVAIGAGEGLESNRKALAFAKSRPDSFATIGLHPHDAKLFNAEILAQMKALALNQPLVKAWGEIGLDYHYMHSDVQTQKTAFIEQLLVAYDLSLPIVIHTREAEADTIAILNNYRQKIHRVVIHCFTGSKDFAEQLKPLDAYLGVGGVLTFKSADTIREAVSAYPLERIFLETDCPYLAPLPHRGKRNEPAFVPLIAQKLADLKGTSLGEIARQTTANARTFFAL